jgi:hypothetical protein
VTSGAIAAETQTSYGIEVLAGYDTNPLLVSDDGPNGANGQLRLEGSVLHLFGGGSTAALFADGRTAGRFEGSRTADAGEQSGDLRAGLAITPSVGGGRLVISVGGRLAAYRGTFTDRSTGEVYLATVSPPTEPPTTIPIPDRLDFDAAGTFLNLRWRKGSRWSVFTLASADRTSFVEDYTATTDLDSLDYRALTVRPGASVSLGRGTVLDLHVARTEIEYEDRPALDANGSVVPGTQRKDELTHYGMTLVLAPGPGWKLDVGLAAIGRSDTHAGYYDSSGASGGLGLNRELSPTSALRLFAAVRDVDYDRATVTGDPADSDLLGSIERSYGARFTRGVGDRLSFQVEAGTQATDSQDPVFTYDRDWIYTGIRIGS